MVLASITSSNTRASTYLWIHGSNFFSFQMFWMLSFEVFAWSLAAGCENWSNHQGLKEEPNGGHGGFLTVCNSCVTVSFRGQLSVTFLPRKTQTMQRYINEFLSTYTHILIYLITYLQCWLLFLDKEKYMSIFTFYLLRYTPLPRNLAFAHKVIG